MLNNQQLRDEQASGDLAFDGSFRGNSLLIRLGDTLRSFKQHTTPIDPYAQSSITSAYEAPQYQWSKYLLKPGECILVSSLEYLKLSSALCGQIGTLSHIARFGMFSTLGSPFVEAGFAGYLTLELYNASPNSIVLREKMPVSKIKVFKLRASDDTGTDDEELHFYSTLPLSQFPKSLESRFATEFSHTNAGEQ